MAASDTTMATNIDFSVRINNIRNDIRRDQAENILLRRDVDICQEDVQTRVGIGAADLLVREQMLIENLAQYRMSFLKEMEQFLTERIVGSRALIARDAINDVEHDNDMLGMVEKLAILSTKWNYFKVEMKALLATENERIRNEIVCKERFDQKLYSGYINKLETAARDMQRLKNAIKLARNACMQGRMRNEKRKRTTTDTAENTAEFGCDRTADDADEFKEVTNIRLEEALERSMRRANRMQVSLDFMARNVVSFKYRDKRGLYKNIVYRCSRYRWMYTHRNRYYASSTSFYTIAEAMMSLIDHKSNRIA